MTTTSPETTTENIIPTMPGYVAPRSADGRKRPATVRRFPPGLVDSVALELKPAREELDALGRQLVEVDAELRSIAAGAAEAKREDLADLATAIRSGKGDPGDRRQAAAEARRTELDRRRAGVLRAIEAAQRDVAILLGQRRTEWATAMDEALSVDRAAAREALATLTQRWETLAARTSARRWLDQPGTGKSLSGTLGSTSLPSDGDRDSRHAVSAVLASLEAVLAEPVGRMPMVVSRQTDKPELALDEDGEWVRAPGKANPASAPETTPQPATDAADGTEAPRHR